MFHSQVFSEMTKRVTSSSALPPSLSDTRHTALTAPFTLKALSCAGPRGAPPGLGDQTAQQGRAITQHALLRRAVSHTVLSLADRRTCHDTVGLSCRDWWRGEWAGLAGVLQGLCPVERKNRNWLPFEWEAASYSPCGLRLTSRCASEQYLRRNGHKHKGRSKEVGDFLMRSGVMLSVARLGASIPGIMVWRAFRCSLVTPLSLHTLSTKRLIKRTTELATSELSASSKPLSVS